MAERGFRTFSGHYMGVAEDGQGLAHIVWGVMKQGLTKSGEGEIWQASVRLVGTIREQSSQ